MTPSLILACVWGIAANVAAMFPSRHHHWPTARVLIVTGVPILIWVFAQNHWLVGVLVLIAALSILRWPVLYLGRWVRRQAGRVR